jgi:tRNA pseudouridine38-40 synthase
MQVVHFDTSVVRQPSAWVRGCNTFLPADIAIQWACEVPHHFHARASAKSRRYAYIVLESKVRPSLEIHQVGWVFQQLNLQAMQKASDYLLGQHDFSSFRASSCQALNPIKTIYSLQIRKLGAYWRFDFEANAFLHRMIRNLVASLIFVGKGKRPPHWIQTVLNAKDRSMAAPTFAPDGLYFLGPRYSSTWQLPETTSAFDYLPGSTFSENTIKPNTHFQLTP